MGEAPSGAMSTNLIHEGKLDRAATAKALQEFLQSAVKAAGFDLRVNVHAADAGVPASDGEAEVFADVDGRDKEILLQQGGEVLKALEHVALRALRLDSEWHEKILVDCAGFRALRFEELRMTARVAAERVESAKQSFTLNPMSSRERRIVHLALKDVAGVRTESIGAGEKRQVVIHPASGGARPGQAGR